MNIYMDTNKDSFKLKLIKMIYVWEETYLSLYWIVY